MLKLIILFEDFEALAIEKLKEKYPHIAHKDIEYQLYRHDVPGPICEMPTQVVIPMT